MILRPYQRAAIDMTYEWMRNNSGNPCIVIPPGGGKSVVIAELCRDAIQSWPGTRILMLTRSLELIEQNAARLRALWPNAPIGIYSASIGKKHLGEPITIGGPLSVVRAIDRIGKIDLIICDECHDISHKDEGSYCKIIGELTAINPSLRVIGLTATPYRLGHGYITDKPAIFDELLYPTKIDDMINSGFLSPLRSKLTGLQIDTTGVHKRGGEYIESELQHAVNTHDNNTAIVNESISWGNSQGRKKWMFFATGVAHAIALRDMLRDRGISAEAITGDMNKSDRRKAVDDFRSGKLRAVTQVNCLSTGFDVPDIDMLVLARPTQSPGLYMQQAGRGLRIAPGKTDCLVLDFAGLVSMHGPITAVNPPKRKGSGGGDAPVKVCPECSEIVHASARKCPACGYKFPIEKEEKAIKRHNDDIMGLHGTDLECQSWEWRRHVSRISGKEMLAVTYYGHLSDKPITEYLPVLHDGYAGQKAMQTLSFIASRSGVEYRKGGGDIIDNVISTFSNAKPPSIVEYRMDGKFPRIINRIWRSDEQEARRA